MISGAFCFPYTLRLNVTYPQDFQWWCHRYICFDSPYETSLIPDYIRFHYKSTALSWNRLCHSHTRYNILLGLLFHHLIPYVGIFHIRLSYAAFTAHISSQVYMLSQRWGGHLVVLTLFGFLMIYIASWWQKKIVSATKRHDANIGHMPCFGTVFFESVIDCVCEENIKSLQILQYSWERPRMQAILPFYELASSETLAFKK